MSSKYSLLPDNRSPLERGLELAFTELLTGMDSPFPDLLNALKTPKHMLPYLAQDRGVLDWNAAATEREQRLTAANAWPVRRLAGTKKGIVLALNSLEYEAEVVPWYDMTPKGEPYTFDVIAWKRDNAPINRDVAHRIESQIEHAKSERDTHELYLAFGLESRFSISGAVDRPLVFSDETYAGKLKDGPVLTAGLSISGAHYQCVYTDTNTGSQLPASTHVAGAFSVSGACQLYVYTDLSPGAKK